MFEFTQKERHHSDGVILTNRPRSSLTNLRRKSESSFGQPVLYRNSGSSVGLLNVSTNLPGYSNNLPGFSLVWRAQEQVYQITRRFSIQQSWRRLKTKKIGTNECSILQHHLVSIFCHSKI